MMRIASVSAFAVALIFPASQATYLRQRDGQDPLVPDRACLLHDVVYDGSLPGVNQPGKQPSAKECKSKCNDVPDCKYFSFYKDGVCFLIGENATQKTGHQGAVAGERNCEVGESGGEDCLKDHKYDGGDVPGQGKTSEESVELCQKRCVDTTECSMFTYVHKDGACFLHTDAAVQALSPGMQSGPKTCKVDHEWLKKETPEEKQEEQHEEQHKEEVVESTTQITLTDPAGNELDGWKQLQAEIDSRKTPGAAEAEQERREEAVQEEVEEQEKKLEEARLAATTTAIVVEAQQEEEVVAEAGDVTAESVTTQIPENATDEQAAELSEEEMKGLLGFQPAPQRKDEAPAWMPSTTKPQTDIEEMVDEWKAVGRAMQPAADMAYKVGSTGVHTGIKVGTKIADVVGKAVSNFHNGYVAASNHGTDPAATTSGTNETAGARAANFAGKLAYKTVKATEDATLAAGKESMKVAKAGATAVSDSVKARAKAGATAVSDSVKAQAKALAADIKDGFEEGHNEPQAQKAKAKAKAKPKAKAKAKANANLKAKAKAKALPGKAKAKAKALPGIGNKVVQKSGIASKVSETALFAQANQQKRAPSEQVPRLAKRPLRTGMAAPKRSTGGMASNVSSAPKAVEDTGDVQFLGRRTRPMKPWLRAGARSPMW